MGCGSISSIGRRIKDELCLCDAHPDHGAVRVQKDGATVHRFHIHGKKFPFYGQDGTCIPSTYNNRIEFLQGHLIVWDHIVAGASAKEQILYSR